MIRKILKKISKIILYSIPVLTGLIFIGVGLVGVGLFFLGESILIKFKVL